jgi:hypothetical protein
MEKFRINLKHVICSEKLSKTNSQLVKESGSPGESHPQAPTESDMNLSIHPALASLTLGTSRSQNDA